MEHILGDETKMNIQVNNLYRQIKSFVEIEGFNIKRTPQASNGLSNWFTKSKTLLDENKLTVTKYINKQSKQVSGFTPNSTVYNIKRIESVQIKLKDYDN